ncbi:hypothetical protein Desdi_2338 [Desulfitobacterium dichloroeliminans LMG P-21439]|uniref:Uncharacterized protein n=1 Tax=Desulfitobacterium dichloroeliminans (strain LMG P-21439 / DCA1) TaxID=871963 RepID=L0F9Y5_DESDL|nr:hypothetical protein [Desulfitobacterium dichloroeliminans]AGA69763.1 hypothetical protein Desdi_2338 [Desulfitobacterium dichloroeliminans LMG P-21439]
MIFPIGEWLVLSIGLLAWAEWPVFHIHKSLRVLPLAWIFGWIIEHSFTFSHIWDWDFPRIVVLLAVTWIAWKRAKGRRFPGILMTGICLLAQDLFVLNEPGIFSYDRWLFAVVFLAVALFSTHDLWSMTLALSGGILVNLGLTIFLFDGVVRYYSLPNSFLWHFSGVGCIMIAAFRQIREYYQTKKSLSAGMIAVQDSMADDGGIYRKDD